MSRKKTFLPLFLLAVWAASVNCANAAAALDSVTIGYASFSGHYTPMWIAPRTGLVESTAST